jgi:hypothetical protein
MGWRDALQTLIAGGIDGEANGLFAAVAPVPEPSSMALLGAESPFLGLPR